MNFNKGILNNIDKPYDKKHKFELNLKKLIKWLKNKNEM